MLKCRYYKKRGNIVDLNESIKSLKGVGDKTALKYEKLKIKTLYDLITYYPRGYIDCSEDKTISDVENDEKAAIKLKIVEKLKVQKIRNKTICRVIAIDKLKNMVEIIYFNNVYIYAALNVGRVYIFYGKVAKDYFSTKITNPVVVKDLGLIPKYHLTKGLSQKNLMMNIKNALYYVEKSQNSLPEYLSLKYKLIDFKTALSLIHSPKNKEEYKIARRSLVFRELLCWQIGLLRLKKEQAMEKAVVLKNLDLEPIIKLLPFSLTNAQKRVVDECVLDCTKEKPMNRLVQGDVGSGKTIVAVLISYLFTREKKQVALMAPTDILARQHHKTFSDYLEKFGVKVSLLVGSLKQKEKRELLEEIKEGEALVVIGTHSLFYDSVIFKNLSLIITDEQHRFGVKQREKFLEKGTGAHFLVMSATPIPRTLALVVYGDLDISVVDERPKGRKEIKTCWVSSKKRDRVFSFVKKQIAKGNQIYFVCPAIEEGTTNLEDVFSYVRLLEKSGFDTKRIGMVHGKMKAQEKNEVMESFLKKEKDILVATTVIEVGIDVKDANVIIIENAEMFGLSQLHQLRGRVGRGDKEAYCILVSDVLNEYNKKRIAVMCKTSDGFLISKYDLSLRGPGDLFGVMQHGDQNFKIANLKIDLNCARICHQEAKEILKEDRMLEKEENKYIKKDVERFFSSDFVVLWI